MLDFVEGIVSYIKSDYVVINVGGIGFKIYTPNPYVFKEGENTKVFLYNHIREEEYSLYGFKTEEEKDLFLRLIEVKGLGPKLALPILATGSISGIIDAIDRENILYLKGFPKIGEKLARQIILDLKGKLVPKGETDNKNNELVDALVSLGYKKQDLKSVVKEVDDSLPIEIQIKEALKLMLNR